MISIQEQLLRRNVRRFREGLIFKAHRLLYHSTLGSRLIKKKKKKQLGCGGHLIVLQRYFVEDRLKRLPVVSPRDQLWFGFRVFNPM